ncbi:MAG: DUF1127 domain-containing protein [Defluviimonas sp.]|uniref:DUF1127 domain-containing protein n=1 Tax=Albidovulum sp. TaxID=1872424 RepID=UPI001D60212D|nr:DUF1127 domain-containing protein [Paracoccaceae bacterium]MCC0064620.1 DUF1127 domain-containing protein [Defluviimonas sp.]
MSRSSPSARPAAGRPDRRSFRPGVVLGALTRAITLDRERGRLAGLSDAALDDVGLTRAQADREAARPIWDVPQTWLR